MTSWTICSDKQVTQLHNALSVLAQPGTKTAETWKEFGRFPLFTGYCSLLTKTINVIRVLFCPSPTGC